MGQFYTLEQVAEKLQVEVRDVQRIIKSGQLEVIELPGNVKRVSELALNGIRPAQNTQPANNGKDKAPAKKPPTQAQLVARERFADMARKRKADAIARQRPGGEEIQPPEEATLSTTPPPQTGVKDVAQVPKDGVQTKAKASK